jgi:hypothetical protein
MKKGALVALACALCACASAPEIAPYGKDTFILSVGDTMGMSQPASLRVQAAQHASSHCARMGKVMQVRNSNDSGIAWLTSTSSSLVFSCLDESDPENRRPILRKEADAVIKVSGS